MTEYRIINDMDLSRFTGKVTDVLNNGGVLIGGVSSQGAMLLQAYIIEVPDAVVESTPAEEETSVTATTEAEVEAEAKVEPEAEAEEAVSKPKKRRTATMVSKKKKEKEEE
jgi:hypothetical protein